MRSETIKGKRGQVGETITWIVATIIIIIVLFISIFISSFYLGKFKRIQGSYLEVADIPASKSFFSYLLTKDEGKKVYEQLQEEENLNEFNGNLGKKIFKEFYEKEYLAVWVGIVKKPLFPYVKNDYFRDRPSEIRGGDVWFGRRSIPHITQRVPLDENKSVEMALKVK